MENKKSFKAFSSRKKIIQTKNWLKCMTVGVKRTTFHHYIRDISPKMNCPNVLNIQIFHVGRVHGNLLRRVAMQTVKKKNLLKIDGPSGKNIKLYQIVGKFSATLGFYSDKPFQITAVYSLSVR